MLKLALRNEHLFSRLASHPVLGRFVVFRMDCLPALRDEALAAGLYRRIHTQDGVTKNTAPGRLRELDLLMPSFLTEASNAIHDVGVSSGVTSFELYTHL